MKRIGFNDSWSFYKEGFPEEAMIVDLPHDAMLYERRYKGAPSGNGCAFFEGGKYIYEKKLFAEEAFRGKYLALEFEGVYKNAQVYVNDVLVAERPYGYSGFLARLDDQLRIGQENVIRVVADNSLMPNSRWYSGSGIYRNVNLYVAEKEHIEADGVRVFTRSIHPAVLDIEIDACTGEDAQLETQILYQGIPVAVANGSRTRIILENAALWDEKEPNRYQCRTILHRDGQVLDEHITEFGIRKLEWSKEGFFVNGKETVFRGACIHHDNGILGACAFAVSEDRRVRLLKEAGFNAIRSAHNPASRALLDACDKYGMYVIDETFDQWYIHKNKYDYACDFEQWWQQDTLDMVLKDINHPCVVMYSIGNEISETALEQGVSLTARMRDLVKSVDTTRPVLLAVSLLLNAMIAKGKGMYKEDENPSDALDSLSGSSFVNALMSMYFWYADSVTRSAGADRASAPAWSNADICGYNYGASRYEGDLKKYPDRIIVGSETKPPELYDVWQKVKKNPAICGDFLWTGWDHLGEAGVSCFQYSSWSRQKNNPPMLLSGAGIIDITGMFRPEVWLTRMIYGVDSSIRIGVEPVIYSRDSSSASPWRKHDGVHSWSWNGCEGQKALIYVYADADIVELYLNGKRIGKKQPKKYTAGFVTKYAPGELLAIAYKDGRECGRDRLQTAGERTQLDIRLEKTQLMADGLDLAYMELLLTDENGIVKCTEDRKLCIKVEGNGTLQGFGSADPHTDENFVSNIHSTYYGRAQAVIRAGREPGIIRIEVSGEGLPSRLIEIDVK